MNRFLLFTAALTLAACTDTAPETTRHQARPATETLPAHAANPYDGAGELFDDLFEQYFDSDSLPDTTTLIVERVEGLAATHPDFVSMKPIGYQTVTATEIDYLLAHPGDCLSDMLVKSSLSLKGKALLASFLEEAVPLCAGTDDYLTVHDYTTAFEDAVLEDGTLTTHDRQVLLTTASIVRYSAHRARKKPKKNKDPEWELLITHVTAGAEGADANPCEAVTKALVAGIAGNR